MKGILLPIIITQANQDLQSQDNSIGPEDLE